MDLKEGVGLSQLAVQAVIVLGEVSDPTLFGLGEVDLASTLLRFQRGALGCGTLLAPRVQMGGVNPFLAQQSADFARLSAAIGTGSVRLFSRYLIINQILKIGSL